MDERKQQKARIKENHTTSSPDDWLLPFLGFDLRLDYKENNHSFVQENNNKLQHKREKKERGLAILSLSLSLSLSLYRVSKSLLFTTGTSRGSQRTMDRRTHRNLGERRLYLSLHSGPYSQRLLDFLFLRKHQLFLGFLSLPLFRFRANTLCTSFNFSFFQLFLLNCSFFAHIDGGTNTYGLYCPSINWYPIRSTNNKVTS